MWRKLTILLFLLVLAKTASALPISKINNDDYSVAYNTSQIALQTNVDGDFDFDSSIDSDEPEVLYNLPRTSRLNASLFSVEVQNSPEYVLIVEFFKIKLNAGVFKHLANPPVITPWFEQLSHSSNSSRLSGWKDGNSLYSSRTTYHS
ncbi:hypothetical protein [Pseudocolwellia agarivorans]|uniref:hypothetical protein n=1 Tax=Pseudocolwellia agarivorans TaxID=1911682 RepID=UPI003F883776